MNLYFRRVLIIFSLCTFLTFSYNSQRANALGVDTFVEIVAGVALSPEIVEALMIGSLVAGGIYLAYGYTYDIEDYIYNYIGQDNINKYFHIATDSGGNEYATIDNDGVDAVQDAARHLKSTDSKVVRSNASSSTNTNTVNGNVPFSYYDDGITFDMQPFLVTNDIGRVVASYSVVGNGSYMIDWRTFSSGNSKSGNVTSYSNSTYLKFVIEKYSTSNSYVQVVPYSSRDGQNWVSYNSVVTAVNGYMHIGVYSNFGSVSTGLGSAVYDKGIEGNASDQVGSGNAVAVPISGQYDSTKDSTTYAPIDANATASVVSGLKVKDLSNTVSDTGANTGVDTQTGVFDKLWDWLKEIIDGIESIPHLILDWFTIDWDKVKTHINYIDIVKQHFQPIYNIFDLISNVSADIKDSDGKFYMVIPHEMGGDDKEHCVLDLSVGAVYITTARDVIKYGMWMGFVWYVLRKFDPKFSI